MSRRVLLTLALALGLALILAGLFAGDYSIAKKLVEYLCSACLGLA